LVPYKDNVMEYEVLYSQDINDYLNLKKFNDTKREKEIYFFVREYREELKELYTTLNKDVASEINFYNFCKFVFDCTNRRRTFKY